MSYWLIKTYYGGGKGPTLRGALLPCPFCGEQPKSYWCDAGDTGDGGYWAIECCHVYVHTDDEEDAIHDWNIREPLPTLRGLLWKWIKRVFRMAP